MIPTSKLGIFKTLNCNYFANELLASWKVGHVTKMIGRDFGHAVNEDKFPKI